MSALDRLVDRMYTPVVLDDCEHPDDLGYVMLDGERLEPKTVRSTAQFLEDLAAAAEAAKRSKP